MNSQKKVAPDSASPREFSASVDETLRLIAKLPAPAGLEERIQAGVRTAALQEAPRKARILAWPGGLAGESHWIHSAGMRVAAAAAIVALVLCGGWGILTHVQTAQPPTAAVQPPHPAATGGFSSAGAMRTPQTLNGPVVKQPVTALPQSAKPAAKAAPAAMQTQLERSNSASAGKAIVQPVQPSAK